MESLIPTIDRVLSKPDISVASGFSAHVNKQVFARAQEIVVAFLESHANATSQPFEQGLAWLDNEWEIIRIGGERFRFGIFFDHLTATLAIGIDLMQCGGAKTRKAVAKV